MRYRMAFDWFMGGLIVMLAVQLVIYQSAVWFGSVFGFEVHRPTIAQTLLTATSWAALAGCILSKAAKESD